jgi:peptide/nickel transport system permease protein
MEAWKRLRRDRVGLASLFVVLGFALIMVLGGLGWLAGDWAEEAAVSHAPPGFLAGTPVAELPADRAAQPELAPDPSPGGIADPLADVLADIARDSARAHEERPLAATLPLGADRWGRDVLKKTVKGTQTSMFVGIAAALLAVLIGTLLGALAGYHGGRTDDWLNWFYSVFTAIPYLLLILAVAAVLNLKGTLTVVLILGLTGWTGVFRLVRAEYLKHRVREYVLAADAIGVSHARRMFVHILPNVSHVVLVQLSLHAVLFMKSEVVLSFLGFGVGVDDVSWGSMINEAQGEIILGNWWQLAAATAAMALLITAFSLLTDALRDAIDPRLR